jgi:gluconokinase
MKPPLILALDIGTSSIRAMLFTHEAQPVPGCVVQVPIQMQTSADGGATFDAQDLLAKTVSAVDQLLEIAGARTAQIGGVTSATFVGNVLGVDAIGEPVTPIYTYADTRNARSPAQRTWAGRHGPGA